MGGAPATVMFRGASVDPKTGDALTELAAISGSIYVQPIPGFGSYRNNTASGGTDTGGGHIDLNLEGRSDADARTLETLARSIGFVAYFRPRNSPYTGNSYGWQRHLHLIRRDCADLSAKAKWQVGEYDAGRDGLAVPHKDTGSRKYVGVTWASYLKSKAPAPAPVPEEDIVATLAEVEALLRKIVKEEVGKAVWAHPLVNRYTKQAWSAGSYLEGGSTWANQANAGVAGLGTAIKAVAANPSLTPDQVAAAVNEALNARIASADVTLSVNP